MPRVLLNKQTGDLIEGHRITFLDQLGDLTPPDTKGYTLGFLSHDGWIIFHPAMGQWGIFLNLTSEKWFEDLGEL